MRTAKKEDAKKVKEHFGLLPNTDFRIIADESAKTMNVSIDTIAVRYALDWYTVSIFDTDTMYLNRLGYGPRAKEKFKL